MKLSFTKVKCRKIGARWPSGLERWLASYLFLTSSHWFPLVGCNVPVGLNDGSMKPSLAYVYPPVLFEPWVNLIF